MDASFLVHRKHSFILSNGAFLQSFVLPNAGLFSYLVTFGEVCIGLGLIFGVLTGIAAFFGIFMNLNFLLAGAVSINPVLGVLAIFLVLVWRVAGYYGGDRYLLPLLGTPWWHSGQANKGRGSTAQPIVG